MLPTRTNPTTLIRSLTRLMKKAMTTNWEPGESWLVEGDLDDFGEGGIVIGLGRDGRRKILVLTRLPEHSHKGSSSAKQISAPAPPWSQNAFYFVQSFLEPSSPPPPLQQSPL